MCQLKSGIIMKDRVFVPDYDSHPEMLRELNIEDSEKNARRLFVRAELIPPDGDVFSSIDNWSFRVDQDIVPDWFIKEFDKTRMIQAVKEWAQGHIHVGAYRLVLKEGIHNLKDCKSTILGENVTVNVMTGDTTVNWMHGNAKVIRMRGNSIIVEMYGDSQIITMYDNATIDCILGSAIVRRMYGNSSIKTMRDDSKVIQAYQRADIGLLEDSATVEILDGYARIKEMYDNSKVANMAGNAVIEMMRDNAVVGRMHENSKIGKMFNYAFASKYHKNKNDTILFDSATLKDWGSHTIYQSGKWKFVNINN